ncbi:MAG: hypothetical protein ABW321_22240 [Polyangiales bacterium]
MKHRLRTLDHKRSSARERTQGQDWVVRPSDRPPLAQKVVAIAHVNQGAAAAKLAIELCAAFVREAGRVGALVTVDNAALAPDAEAAFAAMLEAGAQPAKLMRKPAQEPSAALESALEELGSEWVVALGNVLPQVFKPHFTIVVTGHRRELATADPLVFQAQLEVTAPGPELATLLARRLTGAVES